MANYSSYDDQTDIPFSRRGRLMRGTKVARATGGASVGGVGFTGTLAGGGEDALRNLDVVDFARKLGLSGRQAQALGEAGLDNLKNKAERAAMIERGNAGLADEAVKRDAAERKAGMETPDIVKMYEKQTPGLPEARVLAESLGKTKEAQGQGLVKMLQQVRDAVAKNDMKGAVNLTVDAMQHAQAMDMVWYPQLAAQAANRANLPGAPPAGPSGAAGALSGALAAGTAAGKGGNTSAAAINAAVNQPKASGGAAGLGPVQGTGGPFEKMISAQTTGPTGILPNFFTAGQTEQLGMGPNVGQPKTAAEAQAAGQLSPTGGALPNQGAPGAGPLPSGKYVDQAALRAGATSFSAAGQQVPGQAPPPAAAPPAIGNPAESPSQVRMAATGSPVAPALPQGGLPAPAGASPSLAPTPPAGNDLYAAHTNLLRAMSAPQPAPAPQPGPTPGPGPAPSAPANEPQTGQNPPAQSDRPALAQQLAQKWAAEGQSPQAIYQALAQQFPDLAAQQ